MPRSQRTQWIWGTDGRLSTGADRYPTFYDRVPIGRTDTITGGNGIDQLTGGAGADVFNYAAIVAAANADNITAFVTAQDFFNFTAATYGGTFADGAGAVDTILTNAAAAALILADVAASADDSIVTATLAQIQALDF